MKEAAPPDEDLEDGEIEDDDDEDVLPPPAAGAVAVSEAAAVSEPPHAVVELERPPQSTPKKKHLTEAEKSVMKLHKLERLEREKRDRYKREQSIYLTHSQLGICLFIDLLSKYCCCSART